MRQVEPFAYFVDHASAIHGFGGTQQPPDPRYCFHTHYEEIGPGRAIYRLRLVRATASEGELTLRVHAYKPSSNSDVSLVGGTKLLFDDAATDEQGEDIELLVRFTAVKGVHYALYGYFSEPSDLKVAGLVVTVDEPEPSEDELGQEARPKSRFASDGVEAPGRLYADAPPSLDMPVSQDCTTGQLAAAFPGYSSALEKWRADIAITALERYGMLQLGTTGIVAGPAPEGVHEKLEAQGCQVALWDATGTSDTPTAAYDFALSYRLDAPTSGGDQRRQVINETLSGLMEGGIAVFVLRHGPATETSHFPCRNEIEQWVLRLIGLGHDVAQLAFASTHQRVAQADGSTPFVLIVRSG